MRMTRRSLVKAGAMSLAMPLLPAGLAAATPAAPDLSFVDPELRPAAAMLLGQLEHRPSFSAETLPMMRQGMAAFGQPPLAAPAVQKKLVPVGGGAPDVPVYVINATPGAHRPAIVHMHDGGFIVGDAIGMVADVQRLALALDCVVVTVEYRLAPETTYLGSIEDNYAALRWVHRNAADLGVDPRRIAVMGGSAGGGHAALLAITARDRGEVPLVMQALSYPMLDDRTGTLHTPPAPIGTIMWTADQNRFGWQSFLGQAPGTAQVPAAAVPARVADLRGLPPTFIGVGSIDLFVDEDIEYARRLVDAGVPTELRVVPGAFHGFDGIAPQTSVAKSYTAGMIDALRRAFQPPA
ncbi:MAG: hypothetical protein RIS94_1185 [Pseudomonadota bacterium]